MRNFKTLIFFCVLFSVASAHDLRFFPAWEKRKHTLQVVHRATGKVHGHVECWLVYDHDKGVKEGVIGWIEVKRYAQGCGLGKYLFNRAIKFIEVHEIVKATRWYAAPVGIIGSSKLFEPRLQALVSFYEYLGGVKDKRQDSSLWGTFLHFDHTQRNLVEQKMRDVQELPVGYKLEEPKDKKQFIYAARVYDTLPSGKYKALCEVQYEKEGRTKVITGVQLLDKKASKEAIAQIIDLIVEKLCVSRAEIKDSLIENLSSGAILPALYDDLFFPREES